MNNIEKMWFEFQSLPFPNDIAGKEIDGIELAELNTFATGCISTFIDDGKPLDLTQKALLSKCMSDLRIVNPKLLGDAQVYFGKLYRLCDVVFMQS